MLRRLQARFSRSISSRATESVDHFYSRVLSPPSIAQASHESHRDLYKLEPFEAAYNAEQIRVTDLLHQIKVEVPNMAESKVLYSVPTLSPADVDSHFAKLQTTFTPVEAADTLDELLSNFDRPKVIALISLWGTKTFPDAAHEVEETLALLHLIKNSLASADGTVLARNFVGNGKNALVLPATNFPLLALKDAVWLMVQGYRVVIGVQPRYFRMYIDVLDFIPSAKSKAMISLLPLLTRQNEAALEQSVRLASAFRFTGNSKLFKKLYALGLKSNRRFDAGGEISGINRTVLDESLADTVHANKVVVEGLHWSITANNGELCSSTSMIESSLDSSRITGLSQALYARDKMPGMYGDYKSGRLLVRKDKQPGLKIIEASSKVEEYWDKTAMFVPRGFGDTYSALTHCVYADSLGTALRRAVKSHASNLYVCAAPSAGEDLARVGTTGAKVPESIFGSMRSYTNSVGGNHDGVGSSQWLLNLVRTKVTYGRHSRLSDGLPEDIDQLLNFLSSADDHQRFVQDRIPEILDILYFIAKRPEIHGPYPGQPLVNGQGATSVVSLKAVRSSLKQFVFTSSEAYQPVFIDNIVKLLAIEQLSPWRATRLPIVHFVNDDKSRMSPTIRSFLRFLEKSKDIVTLVQHNSWDGLVSVVKDDPLPPYFHGINNLDKLSAEFIQTVGERAGFLYEGIPSEPLAVFKEITTSQAWACGVQPGEVEEAKQLLQEVYETECFKTKWTPVAVHVEPSAEEEEDAMEQEGGHSK